MQRAEKSTKMERLVLCRHVNGKLVLDRNNLDNVLDIKNFDPKLPVAILSIIGESGSGKTTYTNLLIQNHRNNSTNGWLAKIDKVTTSKSEVIPLPGFTVEHSNNKNSEISLWPEAFVLKNRGRSIMLLLLHVQFSREDLGSEDKEPLEFLLCLLSSRIVEIQWKKREFKFLDLYQDFKNDGRFVHQHDTICNSVIYLFRKSNESKPLVNAMGHEAERHLRNLIRCTRKTSVLDAFKNVGISHIPDGGKSFQDKKGHLMLDQSMYNGIYECFNFLADDEHLVIKTCQDNVVNGGRLSDVIKYCVQITNTKYAKGGFETPLNFEGKEDYLVNQMPDVVANCEKNSPHLADNKHHTEDRSSKTDDFIQDNDTHLPQPTFTQPRMTPFAAADLLKKKKDLKKVKQAITNEISPKFKEDCTLANQENISSQFSLTENSKSSPVHISKNGQHTCKEGTQIICVPTPPPPPTHANRTSTLPDNLPVADKALLIDQIKSFSMDSLRKVNKPEIKGSTNSVKPSSTTSDPLMAALIIRFNAMIGTNEGEADEKCENSERSEDGHEEGWKHV